MKVGRIVFTAVLGLLLFVFIALDLMFFGVVSLNSVVLTILPLVGLVLGGLLGAFASKRTARTG
jgi:hypothetical protein